jgi:hypothetical protein
MASLILLYAIPDNYPESFHMTARDLNKYVATFFTDRTLHTKINIIEQNEAASINRYWELSNDTTVHNLSACIKSVLTTGSFLH